MCACVNVCVCVRERVRVRVLSVYTKVSKKSEKKKVIVRDGRNPQSIDLKP